MAGRARAGGYASLGVAQGGGEVSHLDRKLRGELWFRLHPDGYQIDLRHNGVRGGEVGLESVGGCRKVDALGSCWRGRLLGGVSGGLLGGGRLCRQWHRPRARSELRQLCSVDLCKTNALLLRSDLLLRRRLLLQARWMRARRERRRVSRGGGADTRAGCPRSWQRRLAAPG